MIKCGACGTENLLGSQFCDRCGTRLVAPIQATMIDQPVPVRSPAPVVAQSDIAPKTNESVISAAKFVVERGGIPGKEFDVDRDESLIGRWDADNGIFPDIDLDAFDTEAKVSRRHARVLRRGREFALEDLGSTNGTYINRGRRLIPGNPVLIRTGDEIIVGKIFLRFHLTK